MIYEDRRSDFVKIYPDAPINMEIDAKDALKVACEAVWDRANANAKEGVRVQSICADGPGTVRVRVPHDPLTDLTFSGHTGWALWAIQWYGSPEEQKNAIRGMRMIYG